MAADDWEELDDEWEETEDGWDEYRVEGDPIDQAQLKTIDLASMPEDISVRRRVHDRTDYIPRGLISLVLRVEHHPHTP